jgi:hypothetical protein
MVMSWLTVSERLAELSQVMPRDRAMVQLYAQEHVPAGSPEGGQFAAGSGTPTGMDPDGKVPTGFRITETDHPHQSGKKIYKAHRPGKSALSADSREELDRRINEQIVKDKDEAAKRKTPKHRTAWGQFEHDLHQA